MSNFTIRMASRSDAAELAILFDAYRQFYLQPNDVDRAYYFLTERLTRNDSWILVAQQRDELIGFCQLYPSFSSTDTCRTAILNDLYVAESARSTGVGRALMLGAEDLGKKLGIRALELATAVDNSSAQSLYERLNWQRDTQFFTYSKSLE